MKIKMRWIYMFLVVCSTFQLIDANDEDAGRSLAKNAAGCAKIVREVCGPVCDGLSDGEEVQCMQTCLQENADQLGEPCVADTTRRLNCKSTIHSVCACHEMETLSQKRTCLLDCFAQNEAIKENCRKGSSGKRMLLEEGLNKGRSLKKGTRPGDRPPKERPGERPPSDEDEAEEEETRLPCKKMIRETCSKCKARVCYVTCVEENKESLGMCADNFLERLEDIHGCKSAIEKVCGNKEDCDHYIKPNKQIQCLKKYEKCLGSKKVQKACPVRRVINKHRSKDTRPGRGLDSFF